MSRTATKTRNGGLQLDDFQDYWKPVFFLMPSPSQHLAVVVVDARNQIHPSRSHRGLWAYGPDGSHLLW